MRSRAAVIGDFWCAEDLRRALARFPAWALRPFPVPGRPDPGRVYLTWRKALNKSLTVRLRRRRRKRHRDARRRNREVNPT